MNTLLYIGIGAVTVIFALFWFAPERTSRTIALTFSAIRHALRLKREAKEVRRSNPKHAGTISAYLKDIPKRPEDT